MKQEKKTREINECYVYSVQLNFYRHVEVYSTLS